MHMSARNNRLASTLGALALAITDKTAVSSQETTGAGGSAAAALVTIATRPGLSIESLRKILGISQPAAVRLVDRLAAEGLVAREPGHDGRTRALRCTAAGQGQAQAILAARRNSVSPVLSALGAGEQEELSRLLETLLAILPATRDQARHLCRLCDHAACQGSWCPVDRAAPPGPAGEKQPPAATTGTALTGDQIVTYSDGMEDGQIFKALADPTRRALLDLLFEHDGQTVTNLESHTQMTRFGVMKHLRVLEGAGLVVSRKTGRNRQYHLNPVPIQQLQDRWMTKYTQRRAAALLDLKTQLEEQ